MARAAHKPLTLGKRLELPLDVISRATAIVGQRGTGKSSTAVVMSEEADRAGAHFCVWDPTGAWYGLRSNAAGDGPGLPVVVIGGHHADIPLEETSGRLIAELIVREGYNVVIDSELLSKGAQARLGADFFETLYQINREALMLIVDEAHRPAPQQMRENNPFAARCLGGLIDCVTLGRRKGLGVVVVTQRLSRLHKDVLEGCEIMLVHRLMGANDRKAIKEWLADAARTDEEAKAILASIGKLGLGELVAYAPTLDLYGQFTIRPKRTFDSSATPLIGAKVRAAPTARADIDLDMLADKMAATIQRAKADDPKELRKRIRELEKQSGTAVKVDIQRVEVPVLKPGNKLETVLMPALKAMPDRLDRAIEEIRKLRAAVDGAQSARPATVDAERRAVQSTAPPPAPRKTRDPVGVARPVVPISSNGGPPSDLTGPQQRVLDALAWLEAVGFAQPTKIQVGFVAGYRVGKNVGGTFGNILGQLRGGGLIDYPTTGRACLTDAGRSTAEIPDIEQSTQGLQRAFYDRLAAPEQRVLQAIVAAYPDAISKQDAGHQAGYTVGANIGGTFANILGRLRSLGLIDYPAPGLVVATEVLFL